MAITYIIAPVPQWLFTDDDGNILAGGKMNAYRSEDHSTPKTVYAKPGGEDPYPEDIIFNGSGMAGPFYWEQDSDNPGELYFLEVYDSNDNIVFTIDNYPTVNTGSGGSVTTALRDATNYLINNTFDHSVVEGATALDVSNLTNVLIAPGAHQGFTLPATTLLGGDIRFVKNKTGATDSVTFPEFGLGDNSLSTDLTPTNYFNLACTGVTTGEVHKRLQIAINKDVQNFSNQEVTITFWGKSSGANKQVTVNFMQFFGDGGSPSTTVLPAVMVKTLTTEWVQYHEKVTVTTVSGKSLGTCENDLFFLNFNFPTNAEFNTSIAKPAMYLGNSFPSLDYQDADYVAAITDAPRTGDIRMSMNSFAPFGWVAMNDGTIGSPTSNATNRANADVYPLYELIWSSIDADFAPVYTSAGAASSKGASASADYVANKQLQLTRTLGRVLAGAWGGSTQAGLATTKLSPTITSVDFGTEKIKLSSATGLMTGASIIFSGAGVMPGNLTAGVVYYIIRLATTDVDYATDIKVADTAELAIAGTARNLTAGFIAPITAQTPAYVLGEYDGNYTHTLTKAELPDPLVTTAQSVAVGSGGAASVIQSGTLYSDGTISNNGGNQPHNIMQNTVFMNIFAKL